MTAIQEILPLLEQLSRMNGDRLSLAEIAESVGRTPTHFQRVFKALVGESPLQFNKRVRLQRAAAMLLATERTVLEVALESGFESHEGFTRAFRNVFKESPSAFRQRCASADNLKTHLEIVNRAAPCVSLYRVSLKKKSRTNGDKMNYDIQKKTLEETPFLYQRRQCEQEEIANALAEMLPAVFGYAMSNGIQFAGPPTTRYPCFGPGLITIEAGLPIVGDAEVTEEILLGSLCGGEVVSTVHKGPYDKLGEAHQAVQEWMKENGVTGGAPWEVYLTDPGEVPNPEDWLTEIIHPIVG